MKVSGNSLRPGMIIEHEGKLWMVVKTQHTQPGKGGAYMQAELKDVRSGSKKNERFRAAEDVERVRLEEKPYQFLYANGDAYTFMDQQTFEQVELSADFIGDQVDFLKDGMDVTVSFHEDAPLGISLPDTVILEVVEADPVVKGQTAAASYKPAILENGMRIMVPPHIETGTRVVVNTADRAYVERAKD